MTTKEEKALAIATAAFEAGRASVTASWVAARAGEGSPRSWGGVLSSLANKGLLTALANASLNKTFYVRRGA